MTKKEFVSLLGEQARADMAKTGILASLTTAQGILESGYGKKELAVNANNIFGMKAELSGNNWPSDWGGQTYTKETNEQKPNGEVYTITAAFRKYESMAESIKDHSDYLAGAKKGNDLRYAGLVGERDYKKAIQTVKAGGYATDNNYVSKICSIIEKWNLTQYDTQEAGQNMNIKIIDATMKKSPCLTGGRTIKPIGPYLHSIGCPCEKAMNIINNENRADAGAGVHAVIQHTGEVYVGLPINPEKKTAVRNWHGGSGPKGSCNNTHIGVEMTEPATIKYTGGASWIELSDGSNTKAVVLKNYRNAVEYFAYLCQEFGWNPEKDGVILSHSEGHARGCATNHADVEHIWKKYGLTMDQFRKDVKAAMAGGAISVSGSPAVTDTGAQDVKALSGTVTVIYTGSDGLNVRTTPSFASGNVKKVVNNGEAFTVTGISKDEKWYQINDGGAKAYITAVPDYVSFKATPEQKANTAGTGYFRVRKDWKDAASQIGAFKDRENAVELAKQNAGYYVFDNDGNRIYPEAPAAPVAAEYKVNVTTSDLRIRKGPGTTFDYWKKDGKPVYTGKGAFTIVEEAEGPGASKWGLLKAYAAGRNGWVSLDYTKKA